VHPVSADSHHTDVIIVGAGPAGLFAVFECGMLGLACHVVDALEAPGGQLTALYPEKPIFDIPGMPRVDAADLAARLAEQAAPFNPVYHLGQQVTRLERAGDAWRITTAADTVITAPCVVIAAGVGAFGPNRPPLENLETYEAQGPGLGVKYLVSRREDFRGRRVVIAGGGDSAVDWAVNLVDVAESIAVVHRRARFRAQAETVRQMEELAGAGKVELVVPYQLAALEGDGALTDVIVRDLDGGERKLPADVLLPFFGLSQNLGPIAAWGLNLDRNLITVDAATMNAGRPGLFAVGDITAYPGKLKLILTGFAEAAVAAHAAHAVARPDEILHFEYSTTKGVPGQA